MTRLLSLIVVALLLAPARPDANRRWMSGFELNSATAAMEWTALGGTPAVGTTQVRSGTYSGEITTVGAATEYFEYQTPNMAAGDVWSLRMYIYITDAPDAATWVIGMCDTLSVNAGIGVQLNTDRTLNLVRDCTTSATLGSASSAIPLNEWHYIELQGNFDTDGCNARLDGSSFASGTCTGDVSANRLRFGVGCNAATVANTTLFIDDIAFNDDNGSNQTSFPGAGSIMHLRPNGAGDADTTVTVVGGGNAHDAIDEVTPDDATTQLYLTANTSILDVDVDNPTIPDSNDTITLVGILGRVRTFDTCTASAASATWRTRVKSQASGTVVTGATITFNTSTFVTGGDGTATTEKDYQVAYVDPQAGGAWTQALLNTMQIGVSTTDATPDICVTALWAAVEYVPVAAPGGCTAYMSLLGVGC